LNTYFDTSVLLKTYIEDALSEVADALLFEAGTPIPFTHLHAIELPTAIRLKRFRKEITVEQETASLETVSADVASGRLQCPPYDLDTLFRHAEAISQRHAATIGARSMDILHVAAALESNCTELVSFDNRQRKLALAEGMTISPRSLPKK
jgi:predicted nucleic acid-binding protein